MRQQQQRAAISFKNFNRNTGSQNKENRASTVSGLFKKRQKSQTKLPL